MNLREMIARRKAAFDAARAISDLAEKEDRDFTADESSKFDTLTKEARDLQSRIARKGSMAEDVANGLGSSGPRSGRQDPNIGMTDDEVESYSLVRAIRAIADSKTGNHAALESAGLELEASRAVAKKLGKEPRGLFVPYDFLSKRTEKRDLLVGTPTAGGNLVATNLLGASFIDLLRNAMVVQQAGATMLSGLVGNVAIPRQTGGATAYWLAENGAATESQQVVDQVPLTPKTVGAYTDYSRRLFLQSSIDVEGFVRNDLARVLALAIDLAALHGTGAGNQPTGVAVAAGVGSVVGGTNGASPTWGNMIGLETEVAIDNADMGKLGYITNAKVRGKLKQTEKATNTGQFVWNGNEVNGYSAFVSNQVSSTLVKGISGAVCSAIFFGNWADVLIGMWGGLDLTVDPYTGATAGTTRIVALQDVDVAIRHPESFAVMLDALTV